MFFSQLAANDVLWISLITGTLAQFLKPFTHWLYTREWDWKQMAATGGMPSSHSAMVCAVATGIGLELGFHSPPFAGAVVLAVIVTYDAAGVRRAAGTHARAINLIIAELLAGSPLQELHLKEVLGHNRKEVAVGVLFGITTMLLWKLIVQPLFVS